jgi:ABC-type Fe3+-hydroxamate transport system substrate-binding protein
MKVHCELLDHRFDLPRRPERVVCLTSGITEALFAIKCGDRVVGVTSYCARYVPNLDRPVIGDYLGVDDSLLEKVRPDLILVTAGVQRSLGQALAARGLPVYALPLPSSFHGVLENIVNAAALMDEVSAGRRLCHQMTRRAAELRTEAAEPRPRVYVELWFGRHPRTIGGRTFIHDVVEIAGGDPLFAGSQESYSELALEDVATQKPDVVLGFCEPEHPVNFQDLLARRGWDRAFGPHLIQSTIVKGRNVIHDGPSILETAAWLQKQFSTGDRSPCTGTCADCQGIHIAVPDAPKQESPSLAVPDDPAQELHLLRMSRRFVD